MFASFELVESLFEVTRAHEDWDLDEIIACIPALAIVATWFSLRRWREVAELNGTLNRQAGELADALEQRKEPWRSSFARDTRSRPWGRSAADSPASSGACSSPSNGFPGKDWSQASLSPDEKTRLERISDAAQGGLTIVGRMLSFGDGGMRATETVVAADEVLESISLAREALDPALEVAYRTSDEESRIRVNRWELHEVASQIVANATEAMGTGGRIQVSVDRTTIDPQSAEARGLTAGNYVRVTVQDDGPGIPPAIQSHVFEPFFTTKGTGDGKGLGLAIAYSLVRGWNGDLSVESQPGRGATFEILIPTGDAAGN